VGRQWLGVVTVTTMRAGGCTTRCTRCRTPGPALREREERPGVPDEAADRRGPGDQGGGRGQRLRGPGRIPRRVGGRGAAVRDGAQAAPRDPGRAPPWTRPASWPGAARASPATGRRSPAPSATGTPRPGRPPTPRWGCKQVKDELGAGLISRSAPTSPSAAARPWSTARSPSAGSPASPRRRLPPQARKRGGASSLPHQPQKAGNLPPAPNSPRLLRAVRSWLTSATELTRWWQAWSKAPPPPELQHLLDTVTAGHPRPFPLPTALIQRTTGNRVPGARLDGVPRPRSVAYPAASSQPSARGSCSCHHQLSWPPAHSRWAYAIPARSSRAAHWPVPRRNPGSSVPAAR
jgi:hypothetical protein